MVGISSDKIKIAFVENSSLLNGGGAVNVALRIVENLDQDKYDVSIIETDYYDRIRVDPAVIEKIRKKAHIITLRGYTTKFIFFNRGLVTSGFLLYVIEPIVWRILKISKYKDLKNMMRKSDFIYLFQNNMYPLFTGTKAQIIGSSHGSFGMPGGIINRIMMLLIRYRLIYRGIDVFHFFPAYSKYSKSIKDGRNLILPNGVDTNMFHPRKDRSKGPIRLLFVSRLEKCKGTLIALKSYKYIEGKIPVELHIAGSGTLESEVEKNSGKGVVYHHIGSDEEMASLYRSCDVFIYPTKCDQYPLVVLEAVSSGLYCLVSSYLRGSFDDLSDEQAIEYVEPSPQEVGRKLEELFLTKKDVIFDAKSKRAQYIHDHYTWDVVCNKFSKYVEQLVER